MNESVSVFAPLCIHLAGTLFEGVLCKTEKMKNVPGLYPVLAGLIISVLNTFMQIIP